MFYVGLKKRSKRNGFMVDGGLQKSKRIPYQNEVGMVNTKHISALYTRKTFLAT